MHEMRLRRSCDILVRHRATVESPSLGISRRREHPDFGGEGKRYLGGNRSAGRGWDDPGPARGRHDFLVSFNVRLDTCCEKTPPTSRRLPVHAGASMSKPLSRASGNFWRECFQASIRHRPASAAAPACGVPYNEVRCRPHSESRGTKVHFWNFGLKPRARGPAVHPAQTRLLVVAH